MAEDEKKEKEKSELEVAYEMLTNAQANANATASKMPVADFTPYENAINAAGDAIANRKPFQFDITGDALYQQYKNQYTAQGRAAMQDTMGRAAMLTGGYGNSYATQAGQQAYQGYMQQLNDRIPELYNLALNRYNAEGKPLEQSYDMAVDAYNRYGNQYKNEYAVWADEMSRADAQVKSAQGLYGDMYDSALDADTAQTKAAYDYATEMSKIAAKSPAIYTPKDEEGNDIVDDDGNPVSYYTFDNTAREAVEKAYKENGVNGVSTWLLNNPGYNLDDVQKYVDAYEKINGEYVKGDTPKDTKDKKAVKATDSATFGQNLNIIKSPAKSGILAKGVDIAKKFNAIDAMIEQLQNLNIEGYDIDTMFAQKTGIALSDYRGYTEDDKGQAPTPQIALEALKAYLTGGEEAVLKIAKKYPNYSSEGILNAALDLADN